MAKIEINLDTILDELNISKNKLAVEAKLRPNLITEMSDGKTKAIKLETLGTLLDTINRISFEQDGRRYDVADLFNYTPDVIRVRLK